MICHKPYQNSWDTYAKARQNKALSLGERGKEEKGSYNNIPKLLWSKSRIRVNLVNCVLAPNFLKFPKMFWTGFKSYVVSQNDTMAKILIHPSRKLFYTIPIKLWKQKSQRAPTSHRSPHMDLQAMLSYFAKAYTYSKDVQGGARKICNFYP